MGGPGSGRRPSFTPTCDETPSIDIRVLARTKRLQPIRAFSWDWYRGGEKTGSVRVWVGCGEIVLTYRWRLQGGDWQDRRDDIALCYTPTNWGGQRAWFVCPSCTERCAILYSAGRFVCRKCLGRSYASQRESAPFRALRRAQKIREQLGGSANMSEPFPERPKGMHRRTYERLAAQGRDADNQFAGMLYDWMRRQ